MSDELPAGGVAAAAPTTTTETPAGAPAAPAPVSGGGAPAQPAAGGDGGAPAPAAGTEPAAPAGATLAQGASAPEAPPAAEATPAATAWPEDWRAKLAGEDAKLAKQLERFDSPAAFAKSFKEAQAKIAAGGAKAALPENATPEQLAAYRADNGIPEAAGAYEVSPPNGIQFGEADAAALDSFKAAAHAAHLPQGQFDQMIGWYAQEQERALAAQAEADAGFQGEAQTALKQEWGPEFNRNIAATQNFLASHAPEGLADRLLGGRMADGRRVGDDPKMLAFLARAARELNPMGSVVPAGTANPGQAIGEELATLRKEMRDQRSDYWRDPAKQARYRDLVTATRAAKR